MIGDNNSIKTTRESPSESQLVLLCLDHLRQVRRKYSAYRDDLEVSEGMDADHITLAIWALSQCFVRPTELRSGYEEEESKNKDSCDFVERAHDYGNDAFFQMEYADSSSSSSNNGDQTGLRLTEKIVIPPLKEMEEEFLYSAKPERSPDDSCISPPSLCRTNTEHGESKQDDENETINPVNWYYYDDMHHSNQHRFYSQNGLASKPLALSELVSQSVNSMNARSRGRAEDDMTKQELFTQFVDAVKQKGFFHITDKDVLQRGAKEEMTQEEKTSVRYLLSQERYQKVVSKFRSKLADKELMESEEQSNAEEEEEQSDLSQEQSYEDETHAEEETKASNDSGKSASPEDDDQRTYGDEATITGASVYDHDDGTITGGSVFEAVSFVAESTMATTAGTTMGTGKENRYSPSDRSYSSKNSKSTKSVDKRDLEDAERLKNKGNKLMQKKRYEEAKECYTSALKILPAGPTSHIYFSNRAAAYLSMRQFREAVWDSERSLALKPNYPKAHARLGLALFLLKEYKEAAEAYAVAVKLEPNNQTSAAYLEKSRKKYVAVLQRQKMNDGQSVQTKSTTKSTRSINSVESSGRKYKGQKQNNYSSSSSLRARLEALKNNKNSPDTVVSSRRYGGFDESSSVSSRQSSKQSTRRGSDPQAQADRLKGEGNKHMARKEYEKAIKSYTAALRLSPAGKSSHVYFSNRAAALCYLERYEEAELDSERSLALQPDYGKAHARLGLSRYFLCDYEGAIEAYECALHYEPNNNASKSYLNKAKAKLNKTLRSRDPPSSQVAIR